MEQFWAVRAWIEPKAEPWDLAALKVITEEAGGVFFNFDGGSSIYGDNCAVCVPAPEVILRDFILGAPAQGPV